MLVARGGLFLGLRLTCTASILRSHLDEADTCFLSTVASFGASAPHSPFAPATVDAKSTWLCSLACLCFTEVLVAAFAILVS